VPQSPPSRHPAVPSDLAPFPGKLELICKGCGRKGKFAVGRVSVDLLAFDPVEPSGHWLEEAVAFSGYFRCKHCDAGGPWGLSSQTRVRLMTLIVLGQKDPRQAVVHLARAQLFDGTFCQTATGGEAYLTKLITGKPTDSFLWTRLGNLYTAAELPERAFDAFSKAVAVNPQDVEALHSLACYWLEKGENVRAAAHFTKVLKYCRATPARNPDLWRNMVRHTLEELFDLHHQSQGRIPFLPRLKPDPAVRNLTDPVVFLTRLDLAEEESWEKLTDMYLTGNGGDSAPRRAATPSPTLRIPAASADPAKRVGRNDRCPCGSGKKFKHCCGRAR
jgi:hypothetical protein